MAGITGKTVHACSTFRSDDGRYATILKVNMQHSCAHCTNTDAVDPVVRERNRNVRLSVVTASDSTILETFVDSTTSSSRNNSSKDLSKQVQLENVTKMSYNI